MLSRLCVARCAAAPLFHAALKTPQKPLVFRTLRNRPGETVSRGLEVKTGQSATAGETAFGLGQGAVAGGAAIGIGALAFYGLGLSKETGALENSQLWPQYVKQRIRATYMYLGGSILITAASAAVAFRSPAMMNLVTRQGWLAIAGTFAAMMGTGALAQSIEYSPGIGPKQFAWILHTAVMGAVIAPLCFVGGPILIRAGWYTAGIVGGLSTIAVCAPSEKFLNMGGPLAIGLGVVFASSLASMFLPPTSAIGAGVYSISLYGGLLLFSAFLLYDTQRIIKTAEQWPIYAAKPYDPINTALAVYMDTLNIFIRLVTILAGGGSRRK